MKPLHVALIVKNSPAAFERECRNMGMWSYPVEQFTWEHIAPGKGVTLDTKALAARGFDLIFHEDGGAWCDYAGSALPIVYYTIDSTLSDEFHFRPRFEQARKADLVLVDHDRLERFAPCGKPVRRLGYCVNDRLFHPAGKTIDVCFRCGGSPERAAMRALLSEMCKAHGLRYVSGAAALGEYAADMNRAKVVVNVPRAPANRPHRVLDALMSGAALISEPFPQLAGEHLEAYANWLPFGVLGIEGVAQVVERGGWQPLAEMGRRTAETYHRWSTRAEHLRQMLNKELGL